MNPQYMMGHYSHNKLVDKLAEDYSSVYKH